MTYIYRITNNINGKTYIGQHKLPKGKTPMNDNYMGSGNRVIYAQKKYGIENFTKEIIVCFFGDTKKYADASEIYYIEKERKEKGRDNVYNISLGGEGGSIYKTGEYPEDVRLKMSKARLGKEPWNKGLLPEQSHRYKSEAWEFLKKNYKGSKLSGRELEKILLENGFHLGYHVINDHRDRFA